MFLTFLLTFNIFGHLIGESGSVDEAEKSRTKIIYYLE